MEQDFVIDENMTYEKAVEKLNDIVKKLNEGKVTLDESLKYYKYGAALIEFCNNRLNEVKQQIEIVDADSSATAPFDV